MTQENDIDVLHNTDDQAASASIRAAGSASPHTKDAADEAALVRSTDEEPTANVDTPNSNTNSQDRWVILLIPLGYGGKKAVHIKMPTARPDGDFFKDLKRAYSNQRSLWARIRGLKFVLNIHFVHFYLTEPELANLGKIDRKKGVWPPPDLKARWVYKPCFPPRDAEGNPVLPLVPPDYMLHRWSSQTTTFRLPPRLGAAQATPT